MRYMTRTSLLATGLAFALSGAAFAQVVGEIDPDPAEGDLPGDHIAQRANRCCGKTAQDQLHPHGPVQSQPGQHQHRSERRVFPNQSLVHNAAEVGWVRSDQPSRGGSLLVSRGLPRHDEGHPFRGMSLSVWMGR